VVGYEALAPWIERIEHGEREVLTREPVLVLERTSGSVAGPKHIPYTQGLLSDFGAATSPWLDDLAQTFPRLLSSRQYWSLSPASREPEVTRGGLRIGLDDDTEYFDSATRFAMSGSSRWDSSVGHLRDVDVWRTRTLEQLVATEDLGFISVWNPSFLTLLMQELMSRWPSYVYPLSNRRRSAIEARLDKAGTFVAEAVWPKLQVISCWTDAWAAQALRDCGASFPPRPSREGAARHRGGGVVSALGAPRARGGGHQPLPRVRVAGRRPRARRA